MCCTGNEAICNLLDKQNAANLFIYCFPEDLWLCLPACSGIIKNVFCNVVCHPKSRAAEEKATRERTQKRKLSCLCCIVVFIYWPSIEIIIQPSWFMLDKHRTGLILRTRCSWVYVILQWKERHKYNSVVLRWHQKSASGYFKLLVMGSY